MTDWPPSLPSANPRPRPYRCPGPRGPHEKSVIIGAEATRVHVPSTVGIDENGCGKVKVLSTKLPLATLSDDDTDPTCTLLLNSVKLLFSLF